MKMSENNPNICGGCAEVYGESECIGCGFYKMEEII